MALKPAGERPRSQDVFQGVVDQVMTPQPLPIQSDSVKHLAFELMDAVMQQNYTIRDQLKGLMPCSQSTFSQLDLFVLRQIGS